MKVKKRILTILAFIVALLLIYGYAIIIFMPKDENDLGGSRYYGYANFKYERKNSIDAIICGDSNAYCGFSPLELYKQTGITSYMRAGSQESIVNVETILKETLKYQKPKLVILDADCMFQPNIFFSGTTRQKFINLIAPFYFHARWKELSFKDFVTLPKPTNSFLKGYVLERNVYTNTYQKSERDLSIAPTCLDMSVKKSFNNIVNICKKNNIDLLLVYLPSPASWSHANSNAMQQLADEYSLPFIDLNYGENDFNLNYATAFYDNGDHLNIKGTTYTTQYLANYIKTNYSLPDHREEEAFANWDSLIPLYEQLIQM